MERLPPSKSLLLHAYYRATMPLRRLRKRRALALGRAPMSVLFYHRVADGGPDGWTIPNREFDRQIDWLARRFDLVSLEEIQTRMGRGGRPGSRLCLSITFDDGYSANCRHAIPLLLKRRIPCTYFVTVGNLETGRPFFPDWAGDESLLPNSVEEIRHMAAGGIEIGAHTRSHPNLATLGSPRRLEAEIRDAGRRLEDLVGRRVRYFAFPFGQYGSISSTAFQVARDAGYEAVCTAYGGYNFPGDDPFHIQRIHVDGGMIRLKNRVTWDPRMARTPRFRFQPVRDGQAEAVPC